MTTYARIVNGYALDCQTASSSQDLAARFHPAWLSANPFVVVPDGTVHGARDNGDGTFTNPPPVVTLPSDSVLTRDEFIDHCITQFGNGTIGPARFGAIIRAARTTTDDTVAAGYEKFSAASTITKIQGQKFLQAIRAAGLPSGAVLLPAEISLVVTNWPVHS